MSPESKVDLYLAVCILEPSMQYEEPRTLSYRLIHRCWARKFRQNSRCLQRNYSMKPRAARWNDP